VTRLTPLKPLRRQTDVKDKGEPLVVELFPLYMRIHPYGSKTGFNLPYGAAYDLARKIAARGQS
jgi:hypothetical protein